MFTIKTSNSKTIKRSLTTFIFVIALTGLTGVNAFAQHDFNDGVRDSLTFQEKSALVHDENKHLQWYELADRVKQIDRASSYTNPEIMGSVRGALSFEEQMDLVSWENDHLKWYELADRAKAAAKTSQYIKAGFGGSVRDHLDDLEKAQLIQEEKN